jgi:hypothetical protein
MTRMTREFSLVLLGAGLLTYGYYKWPEQDLGAKADEQTAQRTGGSRRTGGGFIFIGHFGGASYSTTGGGVRHSAMSSVSTRGFGSTGVRVSGGGGG